MSSIGGNVAECAGGPRAFKYGTTKHYVLGLEAVLPTGEIIHTGSKAVKNVVGYDLTQLLVGSEGTLAIITRITLRLLPYPPARATLSAAFADIRGAVDGVTALVRLGVIPAAVELIDGDSLRAVEACRRPVAPGAAALLIVEADGVPAAVQDEIDRASSALKASGAIAITRAATDEERDALWAVRRQLSLALRATGLVKINHDVVVPRGRVPELFEEVERLKAAQGLGINCFGHAGDGNIHVNLMLQPGDAAEMARAKVAERELFTRVVALEGSISGEHGIGFAKAPYLSIELSPDEIALMQRVKKAFDPAGILNHADFRRIGAPRRVGRVGPPAQRSGAAAFTPTPCSWPPGPMAATPHTKSSMFAFGSVHSLTLPTAPRAANLAHASRHTMR
jgi:glycolate oxidase